MASARYEEIYRELRQEIENGAYPKGLPPEQRLTKRFSCARNTVRRAIGRLAEDGYVQSVHGKGVFVLSRKSEQTAEQTEFMISGIESMKEAAERNHLEVTTRVVYFTELTVDEPLHELTGLSAGEEIYYLRRVRSLAGEALILDHNYFLKKITRGLTPTIAEASIYEYMERDLKEKIITTQRKYTVELAVPLDREYLNLGAYNCMAVVSSRTFNASGVQFEYTQSRHRADRFVFYGSVRRRGQEK